MTTRVSPPADEGERTTGSALAKAVTLLEAIAESPRGCLPADLTATTGLPKQTVHRVLRQLDELGLISREPATERLVFAGRLRALARGVLASSAQTFATHRILSQLVDVLRETCNIGVLDGDEVLYVDRVECHWPLRVQLHPGSRVPSHCTAIGKLLLAHLDPGSQRRVLEHLPLERFTPHTLTTQAALREALGVIRAQGYAINEEEDALGLSALAVPIRDHQGRVMAGLAVHAPTARFPLAQMLEQRDLMEKTAARIATEMFGAAVMRA